MSIPTKASPFELMERSSKAVSFFHLVKAGITLEQATSETYFGECWKQLESRALSTIDLIAEDGAWEALVRVTSAQPNKVTLRVLWSWRAEVVKAGRKASAPAGYRIEFIPDNGWRALDAEGVIVAEKLPDEEAAIKAASLHRKAA